MAANKESLIKRFEHTADRYHEKGKREWAYAKNGQGDYHYGRAKDAFEREERNRNKAKELRDS